MSLTQSCLAGLMGASGWSGAGQATNGVQSYCRPAGGAVSLIAVPFFSPSFEVNDSERNDFKQSDLMCGKKVCCCFNFHILIFLLLPDGL